MVWHLCKTHKRARENISILAKMQKTYCIIKKKSLYFNYHMKTLPKMLSETLRRLFLL